MRVKAMLNQCQLTTNFNVFFYIIKNQIAAIATNGDSSEINFLQGIMWWNTFYSEHAWWDWLGGCWQVNFFFRYCRVDKFSECSLSKLYLFSLISSPLWYINLAVILVAEIHFIVMDIWCIYGYLFNCFLIDINCVTYFCGIIQKQKWQHSEKKIYFLILISKYLGISKIYSQTGGHKCLWIHLSVTF